MLKRTALGIIVMLATLLSHGAPRNIDLILAVSTGEPPRSLSVVAESPPQSVEVAASMTEENLFRGLRLEGGRVWDIAATAEGWWMPSRAVFVPDGEGAETVRLSARPLGRVTAKMTWAKGAPDEPPPVSVRFTESAEDAEPASVLSGSLECSLGDGGLECPVPAGSWDLRIRARGHVSSYRWDVAVKPERVTKLGQVRFRPGASIVGWLVADAALELERAAVELVPAGRLMLPETEARRRRAMAGHRAQASSRGFFEIADVEPGDWVLQATHPDGYAATTDPIPVYEGAETELRDPIRLATPATLVVIVTPTLGPDDEPWRARLFFKDPTEAISPEVAALEAVGTGTWQARGLALGRYHMKLSDATGDPWYYGEVTVTKHDQMVAIDVPTVAVEGSVTRAGEPLCGVLRFHRKLEAPNAFAQVTLSSDRDGRFAGLIPGEGRWDIQVTSESPRLMRTFPGVRVKATDGVATVELEVDGSSVEGITVNEDGEPVPGAKILAYRIDDRAHDVLRETSCEDGRFWLHALPPGEYRLVASAVSATSDDLYVAVPGASENIVELVLRDTRRLEGRVVRAGGPVAAAGVYHFSDMGGGARTRVGLDGRFSIGLPHNATAVSCIVAAPGHPLTARRFHPLPREATIALDSTGGTLEILGLGTARANGLFVVAVRNGAAVTHDILQIWAHQMGVNDTMGADLTVPAVEPGYYEVCSIPLSALMSIVSTGLTSGPCTGVSVVPGGHSSVTAPGAAP